MAMTFEQYRDLRKKGYSQSQLQGLNQENKPKSFFSKLGEALKTRASNFADTSRAVNAGQITSPEASLRGAGQIAGAVSDVAGIALGSAAKTAFRALPQQGQENIRSIGTGIAKSRPGQVIMSGMQTGAEAYGGFKQNNPRLATNLEAVGNVASVIPVGFGGKVAGKEGINIAKDVAGLTKRIGKSNIDDVIETGISKGIRPSVVGKNSLSQMNQYKTKAKEAVLNIVKNKNNLSYVDEFGESVTGKLPSSLKELTEAVDQTKKRIFNEYSAFATKAGGTGVAVDLNKVTSELGKIVNDKVIQTISPETAQYASNLIERFSKQGSFTPEQAQQAIANLNESLQSFYKNPTYGTYRQAQIDALITNNLRESLDEVITSATGPGYAELKKAYGALKTIEKDAIKRAVVEGRKNAKGLVDFTDIFSAGDVVMGVATGNPAQVAKGAIQKAVSSYIKRLNSPDNAIKQMFKKVEGAIEKGKSSSVPFVPKSMTGKGLQSLKGKGGLNLQTVGGGNAGYSDPLPQEARKYKSEEIDRWKNDSFWGKSIKGDATERSIPISDIGDGKSIGIRQSTTTDKGVSEWVEKIKNGERPSILVGNRPMGAREATVLDGNHRLKAYQQLGFKEVPILDNTGGKLTDLYKKGNSDPGEIARYIFDEQGAANTKDVAEKMGISTAEAYKKLIELEKQGHIIGVHKDGLVPRGKTGANLKSLTWEPKSQLTDLWNKANQSSPDQYLLNEARKYKSAEEFVKAQKPLYRGKGLSGDVSLSPREGIVGVPTTADVEIAKIYDKGGKGITSGFLKPSAKIAKTTDVPTKLWAEWVDKANADKSFGLYEQGFVPWAKKNGYDAAYLSLEDEYRILNNDAFQTKSQLTDLWKKAQGETERGFGTGAGRPKTITKAQDSKITKDSLQEVLQDGAREYIKILEKAKTIDFDAVQKYQDLLKRAPKITDIQSLTRNIAELERKSKLKLMDEAIKIRDEVFDGLRKKNLKK